MAAAQVKAFQLGQRDVVDYLGVSFSGLDYVGHDFGPDSQEVQDDADAAGSTRWDSSSRTSTSSVGRDEYVVGLSADHGVARIPEAQKAAGVDAGRVDQRARCARSAEAAMVAAHGPGRTSRWPNTPNLYLTDAARARADAEPGLRSSRSSTRSSTMPGVLRGVPGARVSKQTGERRSDRARGRAQLLPRRKRRRCRGAQAELDRDRYIDDDARVARMPYDQHVPVVFLGAPFKAGPLLDARLAGRSRANARGARQGGDARR